MASICKPSCSPGDPYSPNGQLVMERIDDAHRPGLTVDATLTYIFARRRAAESRSHPVMQRTRC